VRAHNIGVSLFKVLHTLNIWGVGERGERDVSEHFVFMENSLGYLCHCEYVLERTTFINLICLKMSLGYMPRVGRMIQLVCCLLNRLWVA